MALFPGALPSAGTASASATLAAAGHTSLHNTGADESRAIATKVGTGSSTSTSGTLLRGNGAGTSTWAQANLTTDITGTLPVANGGTGVVTSTGSGSTVLSSSPTISGASLTGSPTLTTPTIADFTNATHDHSTNAKGGKITSTGITSLDLSLSTLSNPYKFSVYRNAALTSASTAALVPMDTKEFDTSSNVDVVTNKGRFTAPVAGFYQFNGHAGNTAATGTNIYCQLNVNGNLRKYGSISNSPNAPNHSQVSALLQLAAGDYAELYFTGGSGSVMAVGSIQDCYFQGYLVSTT